MPSLIQRATSFVRRSLAVSEPHPFLLGREPLRGNGNEAQLDELFLRSPSVMAAVKFITEPIAGVPILFCENVNGAKAQAMFNDPMLSAFWHAPAVGALGPMGWTDFVDFVAFRLLLQGAAPVAMDDDWNDGRVSPDKKSRLRLLDPARLRPVKARDPVTNDPMLVGWVYQTEQGQVVPFLAEQIAFIRLPNPYDPFSGASPLSAARASAEGEVLGVNVARNTARNNGRRAPIISTRAGARLTPEQVLQIKEQLREAREKTARGSSEPLFLPGDIVVGDPTAEGLNSEFIAAQEMSRENVFLAFGIPVGKAKPKASRSIGEAADSYELILNACLPLAARIAGHLGPISARFLNRPPAKPLFAYFNFSEHPAVQDARRSRVEVMLRLWGAGVPMKLADQVADVGMPDYPGNDVGFLPFNVVTVAETLAGATAEKDATPALPPPPPAAGEKDADPIARVAALLRSSHGPAETVTAKEDDAKERERAAQWKRRIIARAPAERAMERKVSKVLSARRATVLSGLEKLDKRAGAPLAKDDDKGQNQPAASFGSATDVLFDPQSFGAELIAELEKVQRGAYDEAGRQEFAELAVPNSAWTMPPAAALNALRDRENLLRNCAQEIFEEVKTELETGFTLGETTAQLADRVRARFNEISKGRATTIAVTETGAAYGAGQHVAQVQAGVKRKEWLSARDKRVRPDHRAADGQVVPLGSDFRVGGESTPYPCGPGLSAAQACYCRCISVSVI